MNKNIIKHIGILLLGLIVFVSCNEYEHKFSQADAFVSFHASTVNIEETGKEASIPVLVNATLGNPSCDVEVEFVTEGIDGTVAVEGVDFEVIGSKTLTFEDGYGSQNIVIRTIDNDEFTGTKKVIAKIKSNSLGYDLGAENQVEIGISDDDHPYGYLLGDYTITNDLYRSGVNTWDMKLSAVEGDITLVEIQGLFAAGSYAHPFTNEYVVYGNIDIDNMQFTVKTGQSMPTWGYGPVNLEGWHGDDSDIETGSPITFDIINDGGSYKLETTDYYGTYIYEGNNEGLYLEIIMTTPVTWTKK